MSYVGSFSGLNTALKGVLAQQRALDVTGHNIANVETQGYSRQEAVLTAARALELHAGQLQNGAGGQIGQGVEVAAYRRMRNDFLDLQWRGQQMSAGDADAKASKLQQIEAAISDARSLKLLGLPRGAAVLRMHRTTFDQLERPFEHTVSVYRGDQYVFNVELIQD
mgnify:CR=1 FL=1